YGAIKGASVASWEIGTGGAAVRHEQRVSDKGCIAHDVGHAGRGMARRMEHADVHRADPVAVSIIEQPVELRSVALEPGAFVEYLAEGLLDDGDILADGKLAAQLLLNIRSRGKVIGMDVRLDQPFEFPALVPDMGNYPVGATKGDAAGRIVDIH